MRLNKKSFWKSLYKISVVLFLIGYNFAPSVLAIEQLSNIDKETPDQSVLVTTEEDSDVLNEVPIDEDVPTDDSEDILPEGISDPEEIAKGEPIVINPEGDKILEGIMSHSVLTETKPVNVLEEIKSFSWNIDGKVATTNSNVELGKTYIAPQNENVRVLFTKLPSETSKLRIEEIILTQEEMDATGAISEIAYDITTDMENGTFEYDLELPSTEDNVKIVYVEEREDIFTNVMPLDNEVIKEKDTVKIRDIDHFTIVIVSTTVKISGEVNGSDKVTVTPGATITVTMEVELSGSTPNDWYSTRYQIEGEDYACVDTPNHIDTGSHPESFDIIAPTTPGTYNLTLRAYDQSGCGGNQKEKVMKDAIIVQIPSNPPLPTEACGLDIALVLDVSGSIGPSELKQMKDAFKDFVDALSGTPTQFSVIKFDNTASILLPFTSVTTTTGSTAIKNAINNASGGGYTNWEDGLNKAWLTYEKGTDKPNLIIFSSDGNPNRTGAGATASEAQAVAAAVAVANTIKAAGTRILALGIGPNLKTGNMIAISGPNVNTSDILASDVISTNFSTLAADLGELASKTCGGTITVKKFIDDTTTPGGSLWQFDVLGTTNQTLTTGTDGTVNTGPLPAGTYSVAEINMLEGYSYGSAICKNQAGVTVGSSTGESGWGNIEITDNDIISCDFINTRNKGSITIIKDAQPDHAQDFTFSTTGGGLSRFTLDDDADDTLSNTKVFSNLTPGKFTVTEGTVTDWNLESITCNTGETVDLSNRKVTIDLAPGENVTCTFVNTLSTGNIIVDKVTEPAGDNTSFSFTTTGSGYNGFSLKDTDSPNNQQLAVGTYKVSETSLSGWHKKSAVCESSLKHTETIDNLQLDAGETITCTFTNTKLGSISGTKWNDANGDGFKNEGELPVQGVQICIDANTDNVCNTDEVSVMTDSSGNYTFSDLLPGTYNIIETLNSGWEQTYPEGKHTVVLNAGDIETGKNFGNWKLDPKLSIVKSGTWVDADGDGFADVGETISYTFTVINEGNMTLTNVTVTDPLVTVSGGPTILDVGETDSTTFTATYTITQGDIDKGSFYNIATADSDESDEATGDTTVKLSQNPKLSIVKTATSTTYGKVGDVIYYSYLVTNTGNVTLIGPFTVEDDKTTNTSCPPTESLAPNGSIICTATYTITKDDLDNKSVTNIASASNGTVTSNKDTETVNSVAGKIIIEKQTLPDGSRQSFKFNPSWSKRSFNLKDGDSKDSGWLAPGTYSVSENVPEGWQLTDLVCTANGNTVIDLSTGKVTIDLGANENIVCTYTNTQLAKIWGYKYNDKNGDGNWDFGELGLGNWKISLKEKNGTKASTKTSNFFLLQGYYEFDNLLPGTYKVCEEKKETWSNTTDLCKTIELKPGDNKNINFSNIQYGKITVHKYYDMNGNGELDNGEKALKGWKMNVYEGYGCKGEPVKSIFTNKNGNAVFRNIVSGRYSVKETLQDGWSTTTPECTNMFIEPTENEKINIGNVQLTDIYGIKWSDFNANGKRDCLKNSENISVSKGKNQCGCELEPLLSNWTINLYKWNGKEIGYDSEPQTTQTNENGEYIFEKLLPGKYKVCEVNQEGWTQTYPSGKGHKDGCYEITLPLKKGNRIDLNFGNTINPILNIAKSNNSNTEGMLAGDEVIYTIIVTAPTIDGDGGLYTVKNVKVSDIAPAGFAYLSGTWTAKKNGSDIPVPPPKYDGIEPATWLIGDMKEGDVVVLTYRTKISLLQEPGKYPDIAWVGGTSLSGGSVLGVSSTDDSTPFVGTDVTVIEPIETEEGEVLGASITLPATGASTYLTLGALLMMILGTLTLLFKPFKKFKYLFLVGLMAISFVTLITPKGAMAADIKVRIMQPATPTNKTSFDIGFVALDLKNKPITVECYKDSETTPFATFPASTGNCPAKVSASGTYTFYVKALSTSGEQTSTPVVVEVNLGKPSPVINYSKIGNVLKFKTANDGKTEMVEIFRSEKSSFTANASTRIYTKDVSPDTEYSWTDTTAQAGKTYYYALRAVDAQGNVSTIVSDPLVVTIPATPTPVVTGTDTDDGTTTPSTEGEVEGETPTEGEVAGETDVEVEEGAVEGEEDADTEGEESDTEKTTNKFLEKWYIWVPAIILIGGVIYYVRRKKTT